MAEGDRLQLVKAARRVDHRPVAVSLSTSTLTYTGKEHRRWDQDKLMSAALRGDNRQFSVVWILPCMPTRPNGARQIKNILPLHSMVSSRKSFGRLLTSCLSPTKRMGLSTSG